MTEIERIKKSINELSIEELDEILYDCGIELIKPSIESLYVRCMKNAFVDSEYKKEVCKYDVKNEYFDMDVLGQEVA